MQRKSIISIHLFLAAFFIPLILLTATSGGLYLLGIKGESVKEPMFSGEMKTFDPKDEAIEQKLHAFFSEQNIDYEFEYVVGNSSTLITRPTSRTYYVFESQDGQVQVNRVTPDFVKSIVELHKGHGPQWFKLFQQLMAAGLILILLSGFYLGVTSTSLRGKTLAISGAGSLVLIATALL
jgi:hypothetical protein